MRRCDRDGRCGRAAGKQRVISSVEAEAGTPEGGRRRARGYTGAGAGASVRSQHSVFAVPATAEPRIVEFASRLAISHIGVDRMEELRSVHRTRQIARQHQLVGASTNDRLPPLLSAHDSTLKIRRERRPLPATPHSASTSFPPMRRMPRRGPPLAMVQTSSPPVRSAAVSCRSPGSTAEAAAPPSRASSASAGSVGSIASR